MKLQLVILDCDGVLVDSEPTANRVLLDTLVHVGLPIARQECLRTFMGRSTSDCCEIIEARLGRRLPEGFLRRWEERELAALRREVTAIPGVGEALDRLRLPFCVASSGSHDRMRVTLGATGLLARFQNRIFSSSDVSRGKPFPDVYLHAAKAMGVSPERCAVVEDTVVGVTAGVAARMAVFGFARDGHSSPVDLERAGATVFSDMLSLPRLVQDPSSDAGAT